MLTTTLRKKRKINVRQINITLPSLFWTPVRVPIVFYIRRGIEFYEGNLWKIGSRVTQTCELSNNNFNVRNFMLKAMLYYYLYSVRGLCIIKIWKSLPRQSLPNNIFSSVFNEYNNLTED